MRRRVFNVPLLSLFMGGLFIVLSGCGGATSITGSTFVPPAGAAPKLGLSNFVTGLASPVGFEVPDDGSNRMFVVQQGGTIRIIQGGSLVPGAFLDISSIAGFVSGGETGLLGLAFHPNFSANGKFYVNYTRRVASQLQTVIAEYLVSTSNANQANPVSERQLLVVNQPFDNHNGGQLAFGPEDGDLYIALGDGGSAGDPQGNGQNTNTRLGKILRIGVDLSGSNPYTIPSDNPFVASGGLPEIYAYGLRNPWRFSFDPVSHRLFAGDVGQGNWEEADIITKGGNFGWNIMEGKHCYPPGSTSCNTTGLILPIAEYDHSSSGGQSIIGGFVYRGSAIPSLVGTYVFGDLSSGHVWGLQEISAGNWQQTLLLTHNLTVSSFGRDANGELYLVDYGNGAILRMTAAP